jgi:hypothetical protein
MFTWQVWSLNKVWKVGKFNPSQNQKIQKWSLGFYNTKTNPDPFIIPNPNPNNKQTHQTWPKTQPGPPLIIKTPGQTVNPRQNQGYCSPFTLTPVNLKPGGFCHLSPSTLLIQLTPTPFPPHKLIPHHH